jgi:hypothetical protein
MSRQSSGAHQRAAPRYKLFQPTEIVHADKSQRAHLLNLSTGGALVHASEVQTKASRLLIRCGDKRVGAKVMWVSDKRFGVAFDIPLSEEQVASLIAEQAAVVARASSRIAASGRTCRHQEVTPGSPAS